jgi:cytochrome c oxidase assembly protein subunit 15
MVREPDQSVVAAGPSRFVWVAAAATFLLLAVGGLVTSKQAGLAVVDWPNSYGYNMFLYPLSRMTGGIYYEHAHRLFGSLVGLTTVVMAVLLQRCDTRAWVRRIGWVAVAMVVAQGILGGLRVTGSFTLSTAPEDMDPSLVLALVHGVFGQLFFATLVGLGVVTSRRWLKPAGCVSGDPKPGRAILLGRVLVVLLVVQLVLGALQRHMELLLWVHIIMASVVAPLAVGYGLRTWMLNRSHPVRRKLGLWLMAVTGVQVILGLSAFAGTILLKGQDTSSLFALTAATAHQWCGALLFGFAVAALLWNGRAGIKDTNSAESVAYA